MNIDSFVQSLEDGMQLQLQQACKIYIDAAERAKASLSADGETITIKPLAKPKIDGDTMRVADITYPSVAIQRRFEAAMKREMSQSER